jgi:hypothetical protein
MTMSVALPIRAASPAPWLRLAPANAIGILAVCLLFGALLVLGIYHVQQPASVAPGQVAGYGPLEGGADPLVRFQETRIGQLLFASRGNDDCRRVLFDNRTGAQYEAGTIYCGQAPRQVVAEAASSTDRMNALRKSFQK